MNEWSVLPLIWVRTERSGCLGAGRVGRGSPGLNPGAEAAAGQAAEAKAEEAWPAKEQAAGGAHVQAARGVRGSERSQRGVAGVGLSAQGWSGRADDLDNNLRGGALSSGTQRRKFCREGPPTYLSYVLRLWASHSPGPRPVGSVPRSKRAPWKPGGRGPGSSAGCRGQRLGTGLWKPASGAFLQSPWPPGRVPPGRCWEQGQG